MRRATTLALFIAALQPLAFAAKKPVTVDAVVNAPASPGGAIIWAPDGERFIVTDRGEISLYEIRSGKERSIIALDNLQKAAAASPPAPVFDWTNRRVGERDIQWFADGKRLLVSAGRRPVYRRY